MNPTVVRWSRRCVNADVLATFVGAGAVVHAAVASQWVWLAAGVLTVAAGFAASPLLSVAFGIFAVLTGAWPAAVSAAIRVASWVCLHLVLRYAGAAPFDEAALARVVEKIPPALLNRVNGAGAGCIDTVTLLRAAVRADPYRWQSTPPRLADRSGSEGGPVGQTGWTVVAAEAALVADCRPDSATPLDVHILAAAALLLPYSAAKAAFGPSRDALLAATGILGLSRGQATGQLQRASLRPGGELMVARVELAARNGPPSGSELPDGIWRNLRAPGADRAQQDHRAEEDRSA